MFLINIYILFSFYSARSRCAAENSFFFCCFLEIMFINRLRIDVYAKCLSAWRCCGKKKINLNDIIREYENVYFTICHLKIFFSFTRINQNFHKLIYFLFLFLISGDHIIVKQQR